MNARNRFAALALVLLSTAHARAADVEAADAARNGSATPATRPPSATVAKPATAAAPPVSSAPAATRSQAAPRGAPETSAIRVDATPTAAPPKPATAAALTWLEEPPAFSADAEPGPVPTLLYFTASWCVYCRQMERGTLSEPAVIARLKKLPRAKLDFDRERPLAKRFEVRGIPTFLLVNTRGDVLARIDGAVEAGEFARWLEEAGPLAAAAAERAAQLQAEFAALSARARGKTSEKSPELWLRLFALAAGRDDPSGREFAAELLTECARSESSLLVVGLAHADLAVRIAAAELTAIRLNAAVEFDPWETPETRQRQLSALRAALETAKPAPR